MAGSSPHAPPENVIVKAALVCLVVAVAAATPLRAAGTLSEPSAVIFAGENDQTWRLVFEALAEKTPLFAKFSELRWFSFRTQPVDLNGELRFSRGHGLSLHYLAPQPRTMIVDEAGILLRDARGRSRALPADHRTAAASLALLAVLRSDLDALLKNFEIRAIWEDESWRFDFEPHEGGRNPVIEHITVWGHGDAVQRLEFRRSSNQRVEIVIHEATAGAVFTPEELAAYFR